MLNIFFYTLMYYIVGMIISLKKKIFHVKINITMNNEYNII